MAEDSKALQPFGQTIDREGNQVTLKAQGRHDPCVLPRAVPIVEAMICLVLADHLLRQRGVDFLPELDC